MEVADEIAAPLEDAPPAGRCSRRDEEVWLAAAQTALRVHLEQGKDPRQAAALAAAAADAMLEQFDRRWARIADLLARLPALEVDDERATLKREVSAPPRSARVGRTLPPSPRASDHEPGSSDEVTQVRSALSADAAARVLRAGGPTWRARRPSALRRLWRAVLDSRFADPATYTRPLARGWAALVGLRRKLPASSRHVA